MQLVKGKMLVHVQQFNGTDLVSEKRWEQKETIEQKGNWQVQISDCLVNNNSHAADVTVIFKLLKDVSPSTAVAVSFDFNKWNRDNYIMIPAIVYNGNRYSSIGNSYNPSYTKEMYYNPSVPLTISNNPRLSVDRGKASVVQLQIGNASTPAMCFYAPALKKGWIVLTDQQSKFGNHGFTISENTKQDSISFMISAPAVRKEAAGFGDFHASGDKAPAWKAGEVLKMHFRIYVFNADGIPDLLTKFMQVRKSVTGNNQPVNLLPMSKLLKLGTTICSNNWKEFPAGVYYLPENSHDFQLGWVSGMINTYPMLAENNETERKRVVSEIDFVVNKLKGKSGYFYGGITADGLLRPEKMHPEFPALQAMVRKNGDALFWLMKHFLLFREQGYASMIKPEWEEAAKKLSLAFVNTWKRYGEFGQYIVPETGEIAVFNSTAGAIVPAGLAVASSYFNEPEWLQVAKESTAFYYTRDVVQQGLTGGDCGDISMDANSESAFGLLESLMALYYYTNDHGWLQKAKVQAALCATWVLSYDAVFPQGSQINKLNSHMAGAVFASIQNKHAAPGICTSSGDCLFKLYRATGNRLYAELIKDIQHAQAEAVNRPPYHITTNNLEGSSMERIQPSDAEGKGSIGNFINTRNSWTETDGMLMGLELPGIYLQTDKKKLYVFDHVTANIIKQEVNGIVLEIKNETIHDAVVSVFAETSVQAAKPIGYDNFLNWSKVTVQAGKSIKVLINKKGEAIPL